MIIFKTQLFTYRFVSSVVPSVNEMKINLLYFRYIVNREKMKQIASMYTINWTIRVWYFNSELLCLCLITLFTVKELLSSGSVNSGLMAGLYHMLTWTNHNQRRCHLFACKTQSDVDDFILNISNIYEFKSITL